MVAISEPPVPPSMRDARQEWIDLVNAFMAHSARTPDNIAAARRAAPNSPGLLAATGLIFLLLGRREPAAEARILARQARQAASTATSAHDIMIVEALESWVAGKPSRSAAIFDAIHTAFPGDAFAMKMAQAIRFLYGDAAGMRRSAEAAIPAYAADHPQSGYAHGCYAFACEETGDLSLAEREGSIALELASDDAWGLHAVAHVHEMRGHAQKGRAWLEPRQAAFAGCSNFRNHVWWHYALFELELGNIERVFALYDGEVRREHTDDYRDIANAVSLLARLEGEGVDVGERWDELAVIAETRIEDGCIVFADLHYLMALLGADRQSAADRLVERMAGAGDGSEFGAVAAECGAVTGSGLAAMAKGQHDEALSTLLGAREKLSQIGGSHAQRDVFERLTIEAALRADRHDQARELIKDRAMRRGSYDRFGFERLLQCGAEAITAPPVTPAAF